MFPSWSKKQIQKYTPKHSIDKEKQFKEQSVMNHSHPLGWLTGTVYLTVMIR